ncbi:MAG: 50S ribosomal protein L13 [bacterium]
MKTYSTTQKDTSGKNWFLVDASDVVLGRLATNVAQLLKGKHRPFYSPSIDTGDHVVIINAEKVKITGNKADQKVYHNYTGYFGGLKTRTYQDLLEKKPEDILRHAIKGMLPKNSLGRKMIKKLKVYQGADHPHEAQNLQPLSLNL